MVSAISSFRKNLHVSQIAREKSSDYLLWQFNFNFLYCLRLPDVHPADQHANYFFMFLHVHYLTNKDIV